MREGSRKLGTFFGRAFLYEKQELGPGGDPFFSRRDALLVGASVEGPPGIPSGAKRGSSGGFRIGSAFRSFRLPGVPGIRRRREFTMIGSAFLSVILCLSRSHPP